MTPATLNAVNPTRLPVGDASFYDHCLAGKQVVMPGLLVATGTTPMLDTILQQAVAQVAGAEAAAKLAEAGYAQMHTVLQQDQLQPVTQLAERRLFRRMPELCKRLLADGLGLREPVYLARRPMLRLQLPFDHVRTLAGNGRSASHGYIKGRLTPLRPHRDSWFSEPDDCISVWLALSPVVPGNGMSFYPETDGRVLRYQPSQGLDEREAPGAGRNFSLDAGDALLFHTEQLHASELNRSSRTRVVLSLRISRQRSTAHTRQPWRYLRLQPHKALSRLRLHPAWSKPSQRLCTIGHRLARHQKTEGRDQASRPAKKLPLASPALSAGELQQQLQGGRPVAISTSRCVVLDSNGQLVMFRRRCPHEGADLSLGHVHQQQIICPWHNLPFSLASGRSPCTTLPALKLQACSLEEALEINSKALQGG
jgi:nitrite reductase/ring-hydroxylating ferredoxin subunit